MESFSVFEVSFSAHTIMKEQAAPHKAGRRVPHRFRDQNHSFLYIKSVESDGFLTDHKLLSMELRAAVHSKKGGQNRARLHTRFQNMDMDIEEQCNEKI